MSAAHGYPEADFRPTQFDDATYAGAIEGLDDWLNGSRLIPLGRRRRALSPDKSTASPEKRPNGKLLPGGEWRQPELDGQLMNGKAAGTYAREGGLLGLRPASHGCAVLDVDDGDWRRVAAKHPPLAVAPTRAGTHLIYTAPEGDTPNSKWSAEGCSGEVRGSAGYVAVYHPGAWNKALTLLHDGEDRPFPVDLLGHRPDPAQRTLGVRGTRGSVSVEDARAILARIPPDLGYDDWIRVGMGLHDAFHGGATGLKLWRKWSAGELHETASEKHKIGDCERRWNGFEPAGTDGATWGTVVHLASTQGTPAPDEPETPAPDSVDLLRGWDSLMAEPPVEWLVQDLLPVGGLSLIVAGPKVGKSTLLRELLASHGSGGGPFLGRENRHGGSFLYIALDEHPSMIRDHFVKLATVYAEDALSASANFVTQPVAPAQLPDLIEQSGANLVAIDTLGQYVTGIEKGGEYFEWTAAMQALRKAATETGAHICMLHHARKAGGSRGLSTLGSQAISGGVDTIIELQAHYNKVTGTYTRSVASTNRAGKDIPKTGLDLDPEHGTVNLDLSTGPKEIAALEARAMKRDGMSPKQIAEKMGVHQSTIYRWLQEGPA